MKAIRRKCLACCAGQANEVRLCSSRECSLFEYRFGRYPTEEEAAAVRNVEVFGWNTGLWQSIKRSVALRQTEALAENA
jgi:hypothetical protein